MKTTNLFGYITVPGLMILKSILNIVVEILTMNNHKVILPHDETK